MIISDLHYLEETIETSNVSGGRRTLVSLTQQFNITTQTANAVSVAVVVGNGNATATSYSTNISTNVNNIIFG